MSTDMRRPGRGWVVSDRQAEYLNRCGWPFSSKEELLTMFTHEVCFTAVFVDFCPMGSIVGSPGRAVPVSHAKLDGTIPCFTAVYFVEGHNFILPCSRWELPFSPHPDDVVGGLHDR